MSAVLCIWDEFAQGAVRAIIQGGLEKRIKVYSADISDSDIQTMIRPRSPWLATVATDAFSTGRLAARAAVALIGGGRLSKSLLVEPLLITRDFLLANKITNIQELLKAMPNLGESGLAWFDWMEHILAKNGFQKPLATLPNEQLIIQLQLAMDKLKQRNSQLSTMQVVAEKANKAKSIFLSTMSHELRTPLNAILGFSRFLKNVTENTADQSRDLDIIIRSGEYLTNMINNILNRKNSPPQIPINTLSDSAAVTSPRHHPKCRFC